MSRRAFSVDETAAVRVDAGASPHVAPVTRKAPLAAYPVLASALRHAEKNGRLLAERQRLARTLP